MRRCWWAGDQGYIVQPELHQDNFNKKKKNFLHCSVDTAKVKNNKQYKACIFSMFLNKLMQ